MNKKVIILIPIILIVSAVGLIATGVLKLDNSGSNTITVSPTPTPTPIPQSKNFAESISKNFENAIQDSKLSEYSVWDYDAKFYTQSIEAIDIKNADSSKYYFVASTIKPLYLTAYIKFIGAENTDFKIPFKFVEDEVNKTKIAQETFENVNYDSLVDSMLVSYFSGYLKSAGIYDLDGIKNQIFNSEKYRNLEFTLGEIIDHLLGSSSNWALVILRDHLAITKYNSDISKAATAIEDYINNVLSPVSAMVRIRASQNSVAESMVNSAPFADMVNIFSAIRKNSVSIPDEIFERMNKAMEFTAADPVRTNQRHELKTIATKANVKPKIVEKTGYIGLDFEVSPSLILKNGWDKIEIPRNKRMVIFNASSFARIYMNDGTFVDFSYFISEPVLIPLEPSYEELNDTYLTVKNRILTALEANLTKSFVGTF